MLAPFSVPESAPGTSKQSLHPASAGLGAHTRELELTEPPSIAVTQVEPGPLPSPELVPLVPLVPLLEESLPPEQESIAEIGRRTSICGTNTTRTETAYSFLSA